MWNNTITTIMTTTTITNCNKCTHYNPIMFSNKGFVCTQNFSNKLNRASFRTYILYTTYTTHIHICMVGPDSIGKISGLLWVNIIYFWLLFLFEQMPLKRHSPNSHFHKHFVNSRLMPYTLAYRTSYTPIHTHIYS